MNKQNTETETTRNEKLKKWTLETLCNIAILVSGHPEIEDDVLEKICDDVESIEMSINVYLDTLHTDPEASLYAADVIEVDTQDVVSTSYFTHEDSAFKYLKTMKGKIKRMGCIGIVRPVPKVEVDKLGLH